jgi:class 3 adenylate cyclase/streptogramin lyase
VSDLPTGTVSLLFTDIEGSTRIQQRVGDRYSDVIGDHHRLLRDAFEAHGGRIVDSQADSFFCAFRRVREAVLAAATAQRALAEHAWPEGVRVRVRMGIHAGEPEVAGDRYLGLPVVRAARICDTGHGGQVLLSSSARGLLAENVPDGLQLRALGAHALKDFDRPEPITQLVVDGLQSQFPPLRTGSQSRRRRTLVLGALSAALAVAALLAVVVLRGGGSGDATMGETAVGVVDPGSAQLVDDIDVGFKSPLIAAGEGFVWIADPTGSTLVKIDPETREVVDRFGVEFGAVPFGLAAGAGAVWLAVHRGGRLEVLEIGPELGDLRRRVRFGGQVDDIGLPGLRGLALGRGAVWVVDPSVGALWRIDPDSGRATKLAEGLSVSSLAVGDDAIWLAGGLGLTKVDAVTGATIVDAPVSSPGFSETSSVALDEEAVWFATSSGDTLWKLDLRSGATIDTARVGRGPTGVAVSPDGVWVTNSRDDTLSHLDAEGGVVTTRLGATPSDVVAAFRAVWVGPGNARR